jgi:glycosyltransferase involved in cell wall biosynthesis
VSRPGVLVVSLDRIGRHMAGPAIRSYELAKALRPHADVVLAGVETDADPVADFDVVQYHLRDPNALRDPIASADVIVTQPPWPQTGAWMRASSARLVYDLYDPEPLEVLEFLGDRGPRLRRVLDTLIVDRMVAALHDGHNFLCASEKQRDLWLGTMLGERLITPDAYDADPSLRSVLDVVPFGVPAEPPRPTGAESPRARFGLGPEHELILWNGGIWNWLDAPTAVRAVAALAERRPGVRLVFMGLSDAPAGRRAAEATRRLAEELGVLGQLVFFNDRWVDYAARADWLLDADCAISTHVDHLETRFAFRTRLLDCFWAGLPVVCTEGDDLAALVAHEDLGAAVPPGDPVAVAAALEDVLGRGRAHYAERLARVAERFVWPRVAEPLARFATTGPPPPRRRRALAGRHPLQALRETGYRAARPALNAVGLRDWPTL